MPIGSSKLGVLGAGLVPGGTVTFNTSGNWPIPPGVKKVSITGKGGTGNPGNPGNSGNAGNPGNGGSGGKGGTIFINNPTCVGIGGAPGGQGGGENLVGNAGNTGSAGSAGSAGNPGNTGASSSGLGQNFAGGAGGNGGTAGSAGNGGTGGTVGGSAPDVTSALPAPGCVQSTTPNGGSGGNGGGSGANGKAIDDYNATNSLGWSGGGGGGAGETNNGSSASNNPYPNPTRNCVPASNNRRGAAGLGGNPGGGAGGIGGGPDTYQFVSVVLPRYPGPTGIPGAWAPQPPNFSFRYCTGLNSAAKNIWNAATSPPNRLAPYGNPSYLSTTPPLNLFQLTHSLTRGLAAACPSRAGGGGGGGATAPNSGPTFTGGGGGGGRGNAGNPGGAGGGGTPGSAANPTTFNCVAVTPGATVPITVGSPGGQITISWNPQ